VPFHFEIKTTGIHSCETQDFPRSAYSAETLSSLFSELPTTKEVLATVHPDFTAAKPSVPFCKQIRKAVQHRLKAAVDNEKDLYRFSIDNFHPEAKYNGPVRRSLSLIKDGAQRQQEQTLRVGVVMP
jgi:hypothetical protein